MSTNIKMAIDELHKAFYLLNKSSFNNNLPEPAILIQNRGNKKNVLGWCSTKEIWVNEKDKEKKYEINIVAEYLNRSIYEIMSTLLHEMIHLHNLVNDIKDTSRSGTYHNKKFKEIAEAHGLIIERSPKIGWSLSSLAPGTKNLIDSFNLNENSFNLFRVDRNMQPIKNGDDEDGENIEKPKTSSRKYICPGCGAIIRASKEIRVICGDCMVEFVKEE